MVESWRRYGVPRPWPTVRLVVVAGASLTAGLVFVDLPGGLQVVAGVVAAGVASLIVLPELRALARVRTHPVAG